MPLVAATLLAGGALFTWTMAQPVVASLASIGAVVGGGLLLKRARRRFAEALESASARKTDAGMNDIASTFDAALNNMPQGVALYDDAQKIVLANSRYAEMYGLAPADITPGMSMREILEKRVEKGVYMGEDPAAYVSERVNAMSSPAREQGVERYADGRIISKTRNPMPNGGWLSVHEDITERQRAEDQIVYLAHSDVLTGLVNRSVLLDRIDTALSRTRRSPVEFALFIIDLDSFKVVNDNLGHPVGDKLLQAVASRLRAAVREVDTVARIGGDEFAILLDPTDNALEAAERLSARLKASLDEPFEIDGCPIYAHVSVGVALAPKDGGDTATLQRNADLALYQAKEAGRDCMRFYDPDMDAALRVERALEFDLRHALMSDEFELHYQAVVNVRTEQPTSFEALVRWRHPRLGMVPPDRFIKIAEKTGLINLLGEWVLDTACAEAAKWPSHVKVAVNLSPAQFKSGDVVDIVRAALEKSGLPASRLTLEITETTLLERTDANLEILQQLRDLGASIALDDFGTGYSSLSYLRTIPFDVIKIDRSFVVAMATSARSAPIVEAVVALSRSLKFTTIAEGVETPEQFERIRAAGCTAVQGYYFAKPKPAAELEFIRQVRTETEKPRLDKAA